MKKFLCLLVAAALIISFSACSETPEYENNSSASEEIFDPKEYGYSETDAENIVKWNLDIIYKGSVSEEGAESFGATQDDIKVFHENEILPEAESLLILLGGEKYREDFFERCFFAMNEIYSKAEYSIGKAVKTTETSFEVPVEVTPYLWMEYVESVFSERLEKLFEEYPEMNSETISDEDFEKYEKLLSQMILEIFEEIPKKASYGDPVTVIVEVVQLEDGTWETTEESFTELTEILI